LAALSIVVGCATTDTTPVTSERAEASAAAIRAAEEVGSTHTPEAAFHLQLAKEQFEAAPKMTNSDRHHVDRLLMRAQADAELAWALARTEADNTAAQGPDAEVKASKDSAPHEMRHDQRRLP